MSRTIDQAIGDAAYDDHDAYDAFAKSLKTRADVDAAIQKRSDAIIVALHVDDADRKTILYTPDDATMLARARDILARDAGVSA